VSYYHFQLIAYQVPTERFNKKNDNGEYEKLETRLPAGEKCPIQSAQLQDLEEQLQQGLSGDALNRLYRMIAVVEKAAASPQIDTSPNTLKIFMAPEFYFRPELKGSTSWSYNVDEKVLIEKALKSVFGTNSYQNWLFIFGTIVWHKTASQLVDGFSNLEGVKDQPAGLKDTPFLWNTALVMEGGTDRLISMLKRFYSDADDIAEQYQGIGGAVSKSALKAIPFKSQTPVRQVLTKLKTDMTTECIFPVGDNRTLSLEICMEHSSSIAKAAFEKLQQKYPKVDLQLLTACGMRVEEKNLVVGEGQFVLRVDGLGNLPDGWGSPWDPSELQKVLGKKDDGTLFTSTPHQADEKKDLRKAKWTEVNQVADEIALQGALKLKADDLLAARRNAQNVPVQLKLDDAFPQRIVIYESQLFDPADAQQNVQHQD
jgi:hypothetical protein